MDTSPATTSIAPFTRQFPPEIIQHIIKQSAPSSNVDSADIGPFYSTLKRYCLVNKEEWYPLAIRELVRIIVVHPKSSKDEDNPAIQVIRTHGQWVRIVRIHASEPHWQRGMVIALWNNKPHDFEELYFSTFALTLRDLAPFKSECLHAQPYW